ncbi:hypothetical protein VNO80_15672 [Phaseolus coccineus]|uniref:Uncharacterized protein n=1 Tax=Phaseolus coccineus TaxID=3886 RepID=A0AAN9MKN6_PHACN
MRASPGREACRRRQGARHAGIIRARGMRASPGRDIAICTPCATCRWGLSMEGCREDDPASVFCWVTFAGRPRFWFIGGTVDYGGTISTETTGFPFPTISKLLNFVMAA